MGLPHNQITTILNYVDHFSTLKKNLNIYMHIPKQYFLVSLVNGLSHTVFYDLLFHSVLSF